MLFETIILHWNHDDRIEVEDDSHALERGIDAN